MKFFLLILMAFSISLIQQQKEIENNKEIEKQNIWVEAGIQDHKEFKNNSLIVVENGSK